MGRPAARAAARGRSAVVMHERRATHTHARDRAGVPVYWDVSSVTSVTSTRAHDRADVRSVTSMTSTQHECASRPQDVKELRDEL